MKKLNWNMPVKVKLTELGKDIYYHQFDHLIERGFNIQPSYPVVDDNGFTEFQLWCFMELYGTFIGVTMANIVEDITFYISEESLKEMESETN